MDKLPVFQTDSYPPYEEELIITNIMEEKVLQVHPFKTTEGLNSPSEVISKLIKSSVEKEN